MLDLDRIDFTKGGGLVSIVTQDAITGDVLMVAFADREALDATMRTGEMHYHSRTRGLWHKGATSGSTQRVIALTANCDSDAVVVTCVRLPLNHAPSPGAAATSSCVGGA